MCTYSKRRRAAAAPSPPQGIVGDGRKRRILLRGGVVLTLDPEGRRLRERRRADRRHDASPRSRPDIAAGDAEVVDCAGTIVMPGFITTHHHQYETHAAQHHRRRRARRGVAAGDAMAPWCRTSGRRAASPIRRIPAAVIWDLGRVPYDPEDCYIAELVACLSEITQGITCGTDTSQANHTPEHTDAMIKGLMDSGRRMVFAYSAGTNRSAEGFPVRVSRRDERHHERHRPHRQDLLRVERSAGDAGLRRRPGPGVRRRLVHRMAARSRVRRLINNHVVGNPDGRSSTRPPTHGTAPTGPT